MNDTQALRPSDEDRNATNSGITAKDTGRAGYICRLYPGVESVGPDGCPKCGMGLESAAPVLGRQSPVLGLVLSPTITAAAMSVSSLSVVSNALRLRMARI